MAYPQQAPNPPSYETSMALQVGGAECAPSAPPLEPPAVNAGAYRMAKLTALATSLHLSNAMVNHMRTIEGFKVVLVADDSGSMNQRLPDEFQGDDVYAPDQSRWAALKRYLRVYVQLATALAPAGCDVYFLNRPGLLGVTSEDQLEPALVAAPRSGAPTPLARTMHRVFSDNAAIMAETKLLVIVCTDGLPTGDSAQVDREGFAACLRAKPSNCYLTLVAFTDADNREAIEFYDKLIGEGGLAVMRYLFVYILFVSGTKVVNHRARAPVTARKKVAYQSLSCVLVYVWLRHAQKGRTACPA